MYEKIKKGAKKKNISINQLEKDLNFSSSSISKWKNSMPSADKLKKVSDYLEIPIEELLKGE